MFLFLLGIFSGIAGWLLSTATQTPLFAYLPVALMLISTLTLHQGQRWQHQRQQTKHNELPPNQVEAHDAADEILLRAFGPFDLPAYGEVQPHERPMLVTATLLLAGAVTGAGLLHVMAILGHMLP